MADTKKTTRTKKTSTKASVPSAKAVAAEAKPQSTPPAVKAAVKPVAAPAPAPVAKPAPAPVVAPKVEQKTISNAEFTRMVEQAAYYRAEKSGFQGDSSQHWSAAEADVLADLKKRNIRVA